MRPSWPPKLLSSLTLKNLFSLNLLSISPRQTFNILRFFLSLVVSNLFIRALNVDVCFLKDLFTYFRENSCACASRGRGRGKGREWRKEKQTPSWAQSPMQNWVSGHWVHDLSWNQDLDTWLTEMPRCPSFSILISTTLCSFCLFFFKTILSCFSSPPHTHTYSWAHTQGQVSVNLRSFWNKANSRRTCEFSKNST